MCLIANLDGQSQVRGLQFRFDAEGRCPSGSVLPGFELSEAADTERYHWAGREYPCETALQLHRVRCFDPRIGRWLNEDPLGYEAGDGDACPYPATGEAWRN